MTQNKPTPWRVTFPRQSKDGKPLTHEAFLAACGGVTGLAQVLDHFLFTASWIAHNTQLSEDCQIVEVGHSHKDILQALAGHGHPISQRSLVNHLQKLQTAGVVCKAPYHKKYEVHFDVAQKLIDTPPAPKVRLYDRFGKLANLRNSELEEKLAITQAEVEELRNSYQELKEEFGKFAKYYATDAQNYATLAKYYATIANLPTTVPPAVESDEDHFSNATIITTTLPNITTEERENSDDAANASIITPSLELSDTQPITTGDDLSEQFTALASFDELAVEETPINPSPIATEAEPEPAKQSEEMQETLFGNMPAPTPALTAVSYATEESWQAARDEQREVLKLKWAVMSGQSRKKLGPYQTWLKQHLAIWQQTNARPKLDKVEQEMRRALQDFLNRRRGYELIEESQIKLENKHKIPLAKKLLIGEKQGDMVNGYSWRDMEDLYTHLQKVDKYWRLPENSGRIGAFAMAQRAPECVPILRKNRVTGSNITPIGVPAGRRDLAAETRAAQAAVLAKERMHQKGA